MGLTRASVSLRSYGSFSEIRDMIARTAFAQLSYSFVPLVVTLIGLFVTFWLAWVLFFTGGDPAWIMARPPGSLMTTTFMLTVRFFGFAAGCGVKRSAAAPAYGAS